MVEFKKAAFEKAHERDETKGEKRGSGLTLREIYADKQLTDLFYRHLLQIGREDIAAKTQKRETLTRDEMVAAGESAAEFDQRINEAREFGDRMTPKVFEVIAPLHPQMEALSKHDGAEGLRAALMNNIEAIAIENPGQFRDLMSAYKTREEGVARIDERDNEMRGKFRSWGIGGTIPGYYRSKQLDAIYNMPQGAERRQKLRELTQSTFTRKERKEGIDEATLRVRMQELDQANEINKMAQSLRESEMGFAETYVTLLDENETVRSELMKLSMGEQIEQEFEGMSAHQAAELHPKLMSTKETMQQAFNADVAAGGWTTFKQERSRRNNMADDEKDTIRQQYVDRLNAREIDASLQKFSGVFVAFLKTIYLSARAAYIDMTQARTVLN